MYFVETSRFLKNKDIFYLQVLPAIIIFFVLIFLSFIFFKTAVENNRADIEAHINENNSLNIKDINTRLEAYKDILLGGAGLFYAQNGAVTRSGWNSFISSYRITDRYPGTQGVGYSQVVKSRDITAHEEAVKNEGFSDYKVFPLEDSDIQTAIIYIEPFVGRNAKVLGYNMYSDATRKTAMNEAASSGRVAISDAVGLLQDGGPEASQKGFLMYAPVYGDLAVARQAEKSVELVEGFVYAPLRIKDVLDNTIKDDGKGYGFKINSINAGSTKQLYETANFQSLANDKTALSKSEVIKVSDKQEWEIVGIGNSEIVPANQTERPYAIFFSGLVFSFFVGGFVYLLLVNRSNNLKKKEEESIQQAKDELLALASHQLRTPATVVKQYLGMLVEGFAGDLAKNQAVLAMKAYASNERQLNIINELLVVAQADANQLKMNRQKTNLGNLITEIVEDEEKAVIGQNKSISYACPKNAKQIFVKADRQYLRMAIENIINNGLKYTQEKGVVKVKLSQQVRFAIIEVKDNGVGVDAKDQKLLFKKFSRIPNKLTNQVSGTGMGLYIARKIIELHKGRITFRSLKNEGSTVTIELPRLGR